MRHALTTASWVAIGAAAALAVGRGFAMTSTIGVGLVALAPWSLVPAGLAVGCLITLGGWRPALLAALVLAVVSYPQVGVFVPDRPSDAAPIITVMTVNTRHGGADPDALVASVKEHGVEVLAVQELTPDSIGRLGRSGLDDVLPYRSIAVQPGGTDVGLWSRYPLDDAHMLTGFVLNPVQARITVAGRAITMIAFHSRAPVSTNDTELWRADLGRLAEVLRNPATATMVAGDFNATRDHRQFRNLLDAGYTDTSDDAGTGFLSTYPADRIWGPLIGIDHILVSNDLIGVDVASIHQPGSDHRAVVATIAPHDAAPSARSL